MTADKTNIYSAHTLFLRKAAILAFSDPVHCGGSPHPSVRVGAIIVSAKGEEVASASNRFAIGVNADVPERFQHGHKSLWFNCAEQMAIANAARKGVAVEGGRIYVTLHPCAACAGMIIESGLREVYVPFDASQRYAAIKHKWQESIAVGLLKLEEAGVALFDVKM